MYPPTEFKFGSASEHDGPPRYAFSAKGSA
jgi:hypothetical protein